MIPLRLYLGDLRRLMQRVGSATGVLIILLAVPGVLSPWLAADWAQGLPWLPLAVAAFSLVLLLLGIGLVLQGLREWLRFSPFTRWRLHRRR